METDAGKPERKTTVIDFVELLFPSHPDHTHLRGVDYTPQRVVSQSVLFEVANNSYAKELAITDDNLGS